MTLIIIVPIAAYGQSGNRAIDSIESILPGAARDTNKVKLLLDLSFQYAYVLPSKGISAGLEAMKLAEDIGWTKGYARAHSVIGSNYANNGDYANALTYEYKALKIFEELRDIENQAIMLRNIGIVHYRNKNTDKALEYYQKSIDLYTSLNNTEGIAGVYNNMANVYAYLGNTGKSLECNTISLELYRKIGDKGGEARVLGNIANYYAETGRLAESMPYYFDALRKEKALGNKNGVIRNLGNIGQTYYDIARDTTGSIKPDSLIPAGKAANLQKAIQYMQTCIDGAKEMEQTGFILAFQEVLADAYKLSGNHAKAFELYKDYIAIRDSIYDVEKYNESTRRELDYEYGKREDSIAFAKQLTDLKLAEEKKAKKRNNIFYLSGLALITIFSWFMFNRWRTTRRQKQIIEQEKQRSDDLLLNILPSETAEELKATGTAKARAFEDVTVLFTDFVHFTTLSEQLDAEQLVSEIHHCYSAFDRIIEKYGIEKIKTIGDSYMCAGGLSGTGENKTRDTIEAALDIRDFMLAEQENRKKDGKPFLEIRIGCHTGPVVAGIVGIKKFAYDIWGDTVNIASRMESGCETGKVNISHATYTIIKNDFTCTPRGALAVKNKGMIEMYFVERKTAGTV